MSRFCISILILSQLCLAALVRAQQLPYSRVVVVGRFAAGPVNVPVTVNRTDAATPFDSGHAASWPAEAQLRWFFRNGGNLAEVIRVDPLLPPAQALRGSFTAPGLSGMGLVTVLSDMGILVAPELSELNTADRDAALAALRPLAEARHFVLVMDPPSTSNSVTAITDWAAGLPQDLSFAMLSFPRLLINPQDLPGGTGTSLLPIGGSGAIAAIMTRNDAAVGVWKAPSALSIDTTGVEISLTATQSDTLNLAHINPIRFFSASGHRLFGYRTRNTLDSERRYVSIQRLLQWTSHSLRREMAPLAARAANDSALWTLLRQRGENFCATLFQSGALQGGTPAEAYFVRCDATTTTASDLASRRVTVLVGLATLQPAEFTIMKITLSTADPARPVPVVPLLMLRPAPGQLQFFYQTTPGFTFVFEEASGLTNWMPSPGFSGDGSWQKHSHNIGAGRRMFRVRLTTP